MDENRIVLVKGNNSEWYEQAIFILKSPKYAKSKNLVLEAERIINDYMLHGGAAILSPKLEQYKKAVYERAASVKRAEPIKATPQEPAYTPPNQTPIVKKTVVRKVDGVSIILSAGLVLASFLFGYVMHRILSP